MRHIIVEINTSGRTCWSAGRFLKPFFDSFVSVLLRTFKTFECPSLAVIRSPEHNYWSLFPGCVVLVYNLWSLPGPVQSNQILIVNEDLYLHLKLCAIAHTTTAGHRGLQATIDALGKVFHWPTLAADVQFFLSSFIHCLSTTEGGKIPLPFGPALDGTKPNDLVQFYYLELVLSGSDDK